MPGEILIVGTALRDETAVTTQGELLHQQLTKEGYKTHIVSKHRNIIKRINETFLAACKLSVYDVLILQVYGTKSIFIEVLSVWIARIRGAKVISTLHGGAIPEFYRNKPLKHWLLNQIFKWSHQITVPSAFLLHELPIIQHKTKMLKNFLTIPILQKKTIKPLSDNMHLFWIRAYHEVYDPFKAIDVVYALIQKGFKVHMHMAGPDMGFFKAVEEYIQHKELTKQITLHKKLNQNQIEELAQKSTVYLCTNKVDNAPVTFLEMMARGLPIVSTSVGGVPFLVKHNQQALLALTNSVEEISELIVQLHHDPKLYTNMVEAGYELVATFNPTNIFEEWKKILGNFNIYPKVEGQKRILFLGEQNAIAIPWIEGIKQSGNFHVHVWSLTNHKKKFTSRLWLLIWKLLTLRTLVKKMNPDLIIGYRITSYGFMASLFHKKYPVVIAQQGISDAYPLKSPLIFLKKLAQRYAYTHAHLIHAWGEVMLPEMLKYGAKREKILVLPKGINPEHYPYPNQPDSNGIEAIVTRSLSPEYCHETLLLAMRLLLNQGIEIQLHVVGDGPSGPALIKLTKELKLTERVSFYGRIPVEKLPEVLAQKNLYLSVPVTEGVSASLVEAMASGCFPIVTDLPGNRAWIKDGVNGMLVPVKNHKALADKIKYWYHNQKQFEPALKENRKLVEQQFDYNKNMKVFSQHYHNLINHVRN